MDPLTAISLASAIVQFIDFSSKLVDGARQIYDSASGATEADRSLEVIANEMQRCASKLDNPDIQSQSEDDRALCRLAKECKILSDQLLDLLEKTKARDPKSRIQSTWAALKTKMHERQKLELQNRLSSCRSQLELQLGFLTSSENKARLNAMIMSSNEQAIKLEVIQQHVEELRRGSAVSSFSIKAQSQLRQLLDVSEDVYVQVTQHKVLKTLAFSQMHDRFDTVEDAHWSTFEWMFQGTEPQDETSHTTTSTLRDDKRRNEMSKSVVDWLSSGSGIYHISGKLGSGKSTLMKFLYNHERTRAELQKWAGDRKLVFASFFFWKPGSRMQNSLFGLFRTLLHDTLKECPELIPIVLPDLWQQVTSLPWQTPAEFEIRAEDVRIGFSNLLRCHDLYKKHCFCFFIDGLDEYQETYQVDYKAMIETLSSWTKTAPKDVKLCVSSREYNVFLNFFDQNKRLRLQDLTKVDMENYVRDRLLDLHDKEKESLMQTIVEKAAGIFLWVTLVTKSIRGRLEDGYELAALEEEVNSLPDELEMLFEYLLRSIPKSSQKEACWTFAMVDCLNSEIAPGKARHLPPGINFLLKLDLLSYSFLEDYTANQGFALASQSTWPRISDTIKSEKEDIARKRLNRHCQGLIESNANGAIGYTHRSVPEFLRSSFHERMVSALQGFDAENALSNLLLAGLRSRVPCKLSENEKSALGIMLYGIIALRRQANLDHAPFSFLESLELAVSEYQQGIGLVPSQHKSFRVHVGQGTIAGWGNQEGNGKMEIVTSVLYVSIYVGQIDYVSWKIQKDPDLTDGGLKLAMLLSALHEGAAQLAMPGAYEVTRILLRRSLSPGAVVHQYGWTLPFESLSGCSVWEHFLLTLFVWVPPREMFREMGDIMKEFLTQGANQNIHISLRRIPQKSNDDGGVETPESNFDEEKVINEDTSVVSSAPNVDPTLDAQVEQEVPEKEYNQGIASDDGSSNVSSESINKPYSDVGEELEESSVKHPRIHHGENIVFRIEIKLEEGPKQFKTVGVGLPMRWRENSDYTELYDFIDSHDGEISFANFVEYCDFENKEDILQLLSKGKFQPNKEWSQIGSGQKVVIKEDMNHNPGEPDLDPQPPSLPATNLEGITKEVVRHTLEPKNNRQPQWYPALVFFIGIMVAVLVARLRRAVY